MATSRIQKYRAKILGQLDSLIETARDPGVLETRRDKISSWNVGEQMHHITLVDDSILKVLERAAAGEVDPTKDIADKRPTAIGHCMLFLGFIPRGKGKAPSLAMPRETQLDQVESSLAAVRERFAALDLKPLSSADALARHRVFGYLNGTRWLRFVDLHHHHHWKIIRDMLRAA